ncbi:response regulator [Candidatus Riflebacteria bacterium]
MAAKTALLYVDDEKENLSSFRYTFMDEFKIFTAESASEGIDILKKNDIQVIITDQRMPETTGAEMLEEIFKLWPDTIRMVLTGFSDYPAIVSAVNQGKIYHFFQKPWDEMEIRMVLKSACEILSLRDKNKMLIEKLKKQNQELEQALSEYKRG